MDIASKKNILFALKWLIFWGVWAFIDVYFNVSVFETIFNTPAFYCAVIFIAFTLFMAVFEAHFFHERMLSTNTNEYDPHTLFTFIRISFLIPIFIITGFKEIIFYTLFFPFFHDGMYYYWRNKLNPSIYPKKWMDQSNSSTALLTKVFKPLTRTICAAIGVSALIYFTLWLS